MGRYDSVIASFCLNRKAKANWFCRLKMHSLQDTQKTLNMTEIGGRRHSDVITGLPFHSLGKLLSSGRAKWIHETNAKFDGNICFQFGAIEG